MKITDVKTYIVPPEVSVTRWANGDPWVLVEIVTDAGVIGWGQAHTTAYDREHAIAQNVHDLARKVDGMSPFCINRFMMSVADRISTSSKGIEFSAAAAGIEIALWDIVGKALDKPVHHLLGGPCKDRIQLYANCWSNQTRSPDELALFAEQQVLRGFKAVKIYPFLHQASTRHGIACIQAVREAVGSKVEVFVDMLESMPVDDVSFIFEALREQGISWLEDPAPSSNIELLSSIREQSSLPVITGEDLYTKHCFARLCEVKAVDILNPEVAILGIHGLKEVAGIAEAYSMKVAVHNANTMTIGLAAALQAAAVTPNSQWVEFFTTLEAGSNSFSSFSFEMDESGSVSLPQDPGLGVFVDQAAIGKMQYVARLED